MEVGEEGNAERRVASAEYWERVDCALSRDMAKASRGSVVQMSVVFGTTGMTGSVSSTERVGSVGARLGYNHEGEDEKEGEEREETSDLRYRPGCGCLNGGSVSSVGASDVEKGGASSGTKMVKTGDGSAAISEASRSVGRGSIAIAEPSTDENLRPLRSCSYEGFCGLGAGWRIRRGCCPLGHGCESRDFHLSG